MIPRRKFTEPDMTENPPNLIMGHALNPISEQESRSDATKTVGPYDKKAVKTMDSAQNSSVHNFKPVIIPKPMVMVSLTLRILTK